MKIKFIQEFVSPSLGNVWIGRIMAVNEDMAEKMLRMGYAEELKEETNVDIKHTDTDGNKEPPADRPKRRGRSPSNLS